MTDRRPDRSATGLTSIRAARLRPSRRPARRRRRRRATASSSAGQQDRGPPTAAQRAAAPAPGRRRPAAGPPARRRGGGDPWRGRRQHRHATYRCTRRDRARSSEPAHERGRSASTGQRRDRRRARSAPTWPSAGAAWQTRWSPLVSVSTPASISYVGVPSRTVERPGPRPPSRPSSSHAIRVVAIGPNVIVAARSPRSSPDPCCSRCRRTPCRSSNLSVGARTPAAPTTRRRPTRGCRRAHCVPSSGRSGSATSRSSRVIVGVAAGERQRVAVERDGRSEVRNDASQVSWSISAAGSQAISVIAIVRGRRARRRRSTTCRRAGCSRRGAEPVAVEGQPDLRPGDELVAGDARSRRTSPAGRGRRRVARGAGRSWRGGRRPAVVAVRSGSVAAAGVGAAARRWRASADRGDERGPQVALDTDGACSSTPSSSPDGARRGTPSSGPRLSWPGS